MGQLNQIGIKLTSQQLILFSTPEYTPFIDSENLLALFFVPPDGYSPGYEAIATQGITTGYNGVVVLEPATQYSLELSTVESQEAALIIANTLYEAALPMNNSGVYKLLEVWDYHVLDNAEARSQGYTIRRCHMSKPSRRSGSIRDGQAIASSRYTVGGFGFTLTQVN